MKNLLVAIYIFFFCVTCAIQGMQGDIKSLFKDKKNYEAYKSMLLELSRDYLFERKESKDFTTFVYDLSPLEKLIDDIDNDREIRPTVEAYGAKRTVPGRKSLLKYTPAKESFTCQAEPCDPVKIISNYLYSSRNYLRNHNNHNNNLPPDKHVDHCIRDYKHKELFIATCFARVGEEYNFVERPVIFAILKGHNMLDRVIRENSKNYIFCAIKDANFLRDILDYSNVRLGNVRSQPNSLEYSRDPLFAWSAVEFSDVASLILLEKHGIKFEDPELTDVALQSKRTREGKLACLSFLLDRQINISHKNLNSKLDFFFSRYKKDDNYKACKALLFGRLGSHFEHFEEIMLKKLQQDKQDKQKQTYKEIEQEINGWIYGAKTKLSTQKLLNIKEQTLINRLIEHIETAGEDTEIPNLIAELLAFKKICYAGSAPDIYVVGLGSVVARNALFPILHGYFLVRLCPLVGAYLTYLKNSEAQDILITKINEKQTRLSYAKGYLQGLLQEPRDDKPKNNNLQDYKINFEKVGIRHYCQYLAFGLGLSILISYGLGDNFWALPLMTAGSSGIYLGGKLKQFDRENIQKLLDDFLERGREDGAARREFGELSSPGATLPETKTDMPSIGPSEVMSDYFKTLFGGIIKHSKNLFGGLLENVRKIKIRNPDL